MAQTENSHKQEIPFKYKKRIPIVTEKAHWLRKDWIQTPQQYVTLVTMDGFRNWTQECTDLNMEVEWWTQ